MLVPLHAPNSLLKAPRHIHEHKCASRQCDVNVASIKRQNVAIVEKSRHHEMMMQVVGTHHTNGTQTRMRYPNPKYKKVIELGF
jgi:hypothetical protein